MNKEFITFLFSGVIAALANISSRYLFSFVFSYSYAIIYAYLVGMLSAFLLFKIIVFKQKNNKKTIKEIFYFILVNSVALVQTLVISLLLAQYLFTYINFNFYPKDIAHIIGVAVPIFSSYFGHKYFTFKD